MLRGGITVFCFIVIGACAWAQGMPSSPLADAKRALALKDFTHAKKMFADFLAAHPGDVQSEMGVADCELGLRRYESAELGYRRVVAAQPQMWMAHKNLVIVEAALGRWEEFDRERLVLRAARERKAAGISVQDADVIDTVNVRGQHWIVRDYFVPLGRTRTRYNFERFSQDGRVEAYVSLESASALHEELKEGPVIVGAVPKPAPELSGFALNFYDGKSHDTIATYSAEPTYERVRADFLRWVNKRPSTGQGR